jgi:hypothetical protein
VLGGSAYVWSGTKTGERWLDVIKWGLIPQWCQDPKGSQETHQHKGRLAAELTSSANMLCSRTGSPQ